MPGDSVRARPDTIRPDSIRPDTSGVRELIKWNETDSVMQALMARPGYSGTRYQGDKVVFNAETRTLDLDGNRAGIGRDQTLLVADSITYNDSTKMIFARGDTVWLRDPKQAASDVIALGRMDYNVSSRRGSVTNISTSVETGQTWYVRGREAAFVGDTARGGQTAFYARNGSITSCDDEVPDYHFEAKEIKLVSKNILVARPAVLYIGDIPVMWLPFIFQDTRAGRRSGVLPPRLGFSDIVRNSPSYRRHIENVGYYFALSDYYDAEASLDWRSGARGDDRDPGWMRYNGTFNYRWLNRFLGGGIRASHENWQNGRTNTALSWNHGQDFSQRSRLSADLNYVTSTDLYERNAFNVAQALATISSRLNFSRGLGPASLQVGGERTQFSGRDEIRQSFPNLTVSTQPIEIARWLMWSPNLSVTNSQSFNIQGGASGLGIRYSPRPDGTVAADTLLADTRTSGLRLATPLRIFGFDWRNDVAVRDVENNFPQLVQKFYLDANDTSRYTTRVYRKGIRTDIDWNTGISLPPLLQGSWRVTPSVSIVNSVPGPFMVRTERTGDGFVRQGKRLEYALSASPSVFGFFPGFGPITRIRHSIQPTISYGYAPKGDVSDEYLLALNQTRQGSRIGLQRSAVSLGLRQDFEAKLRSPSDTAPDGGEKIKLLAIDVSSLTYDFEQARAGGHGITNTSFNYRLSSDLLPGADFNVGYSLFEGNPISDTARFKPYRTDVSASISLGRERNPLATLTRIFGRAVPRPEEADTTNRGEGSPAAQSAAIAGSAGRRYQLGIPGGQGWSASLSFSANRTRPSRGGNVIEIDPRELCSDFQDDPFFFEQCLRQNQAQRDTLPTTIEGGTVFRSPPQANLNGNFTFNLTPHWAVQWGTGYDFRRDEFAAHQVTLQRELHDWQAIFSFTQAPNGNFAFNFFISLKAQPEIKFDYNRRTYRPTTQ